MKTKNKRLEAYKALLAELSIDPEDESYSGAEDAAKYLSGEMLILRWCLVTKSAGHDYSFDYTYPDFDTEEFAKEQAFRNVDDDIFPETPMFIIDLDTGKRITPDWSTVLWVEQQTD